MKRNTQAANNRNFYEIKHKGRYLFCITSTLKRLGAYVPVNGHRTVGAGSKFVKKGETVLDKIPFDEEKSFCASEIGEICSNIRDKSFDKGVIYYVYGLRSYLAIKSVCSNCHSQGALTCTCDHLIKALEEEFASIVDNSSDFYEPFSFDLSGRNFDLRVSSAYPTVPAFETDCLSAEHELGVLVQADKVDVERQRFNPGLLHRLNEIEEEEINRPKSGSLDDYRDLILPPNIVSLINKPGTFPPHEPGLMDTDFDSPGNSHLGSNDDVGDLRGIIADSPHASLHTDDEVDLLDVLGNIQLDSGSDRSSHTSHGGDAAHTNQPVGNVDALLNQISAVLQPDALVVSTVSDANSVSPPLDDGDNNGAVGPNTLHVNARNSANTTLVPESNASSGNTSASSKAMATVVEIGSKTLLTDDSDKGAIGPAVAVRPGQNVHTLASLSNPLPKDNVNQPLALPGSGSDVVANKTPTTASNGRPLAMSASDLRLPVVSQPENGNANLQLQLASKQGEAWYPSEVCAFCYKCDATATFTSGKCSRCKISYSTIPSELYKSNVSPFQRYAFPYPKEHANKSSESRKKAALEMIFPRGEIQVGDTGNFLIYPLNCPGDTLIRDTLELLTHDNKLERLQDWEMTEISSADQVCAERLKFALHVIKENLVLQRTKAWDSIFSLPPGLLGICASGDTVELGTITPQSAPIGLTVSCLRADLEVEMRRVQTVCSNILSDATNDHNQSDLNVAFFSKHNKFFTKSSNTTWRELRKEEFFSCPEVPFLRAPHHGPRAVFLQLLLDGLSQYNDDEIDALGLRQNVLAELETLLFQAKNKDEEIQQQKSKHPFLKKIPAMSSNDNSFEEKWQQIYNAHHNINYIPPSRRQSLASSSTALQIGLQPLNPQHHSTPCKDNETRLDPLLTTSIVDNYWDKNYNSLVGNNNHQRGLPAIEAGQDLPNTNDTHPPQNSSARTVGGNQTRMSSVLSQSRYAPSPKTSDKERQNSIAAVKLNESQSVQQQQAKLQADLQTQSLLQQQHTNDQMQQRQQQLAAQAEQQAQLLQQLQQAQAQAEQQSQLLQQQQTAKIEAERTRLLQLQQQQIVNHGKPNDISANNLNQSSRPVHRESMLQPAYLQASKNVSTAPTSPQKSEPAASTATPAASWGKPGLTQFDGNAAVPGTEEYAKEQLRQATAAFELDNQLQLPIPKRVSFSSKRVYNGPDPRFIAMPGFQPHLNNAHSTDAIPSSNISSSQHNHLPLTSTTANGNVHQHQLPVSGSGGNNDDEGDDSDDDDADDHHGGGSGSAGGGGGGFPGGGGGGLPGGGGGSFPGGGGGGLPGGGGGGFSGGGGGGLPGGGGAGSSGDGGGGFFGGGGGGGDPGNGGMSGNDGLNLPPPGSGPPRLNQDQIGILMRDETEVPPLPTNRRERAAEIANRLKLVSYPPKYTIGQGQSFRAFFSQFYSCFVSFVGLSSFESKQKFIQSFTEADTRYQVSTLNAQNPKSTLNSLAAMVANYVSSESPAYYANQLAKLCRLRNEAIPHYGFRANVLFREAIPPGQFFQIYGSRLYENLLMDAFLRGLCSPILCQKIRQANVQTVNQAINFCAEYLQSYEASEMTRNHAKLHNAQEYTLAKETRLLSSLHDKSHSNHDKHNDKHDALNNLDAFSDEETEEQLAAIMPTGPASRQLNAGGKVYNSNRPSTFNRQAGSENTQAKQSGCFTCGALDHWSRECKNKPKQASQQPRVSFNSTQQQSQYKSQQTPQPAQSRAQQALAILLNKSPAQFRREKKNRRQRQAGVHAIEVEEDDDSQSEEFYDDVVADQPENAEPNEVEELEENVIEGDTELVDCLTELVTNIEKQNAKPVIKRANALLKKSKNNRILSSLCTDVPRVHIDKIGSFILDTGSNFSIVAKKQLPASLHVYPSSHEIQTLDGSVTKMKNETQFWVTKNPNLALAEPEKGILITAIVADELEESLLSYHDIAKLGLCIKGHVDVYSGEEEAGSCVPKIRNSRQTTEPNHEQKLETDAIHVKPTDLKINVGNQTITAITASSSIKTCNDNLEISSSSAEPVEKSEFSTYLRRECTYMGNTNINAINRHNLAKIAYITYTLAYTDTYVPFQSPLFNQTASLEPKRYGSKTQPEIVRKRRRRKKRIKPKRAPRRLHRYLALQYAKLSKKLLKQQQMNMRSPLKPAEVKSSQSPSNQANKSMQHGVDPLQQPSKLLQQTSELQQQPSSEAKNWPSDANIVKPCEERWVNVLNELDTKNMTAALPFALVYVSDSPDRRLSEQLRCSALVDTGASVTCVSEQLIRESGFTFEKLPLQVSVKSFTGQSVHVISRVKMYLSFGTGIKHSIDAYVYKGRSNFSLVIGFDTIKKTKLVLYPDQGYFIVDGLSHDLINYERINCLNSIEVERPANLVSIPIKALVSVTMRRSDIFSLICALDVGKDTTVDVGDHFQVELRPEYKEKGITVLNDIVTVQLDGIRKRDLEVLVLVHLPDENESPLASIKADDVVADLNPVLPFESDRASDELPPNVAQIALVSVLRTEKEAEALKAEQEEQYRKLDEVYRTSTPEELLEYLSTHPADCVSMITFFVQKRPLTEEDEREIQEGADARASWWTREKIRSEMPGAFESIDAKYHQVVEDLLYDSRRTFVGDPEHLKGGIRWLQVHAEFPASLSLHCPRRVISGSARLINSRIHSLMERRKMIRRVDTESAATHPWMALLKPGAPKLMDRATLENLTPSQYFSYFRPILDSSSISSLCRKYPQDSPSVLEAYQMLSVTDKRSVCDIKKFYDTCRLSRNAQRLFGFNMQLDDKNDAQAESLCLPQGNSQSGRLSQAIINDIVTVPNCIPVATTFDEFKQMHDLFRERKLPQQQPEGLVTSCSAFVDDLCVCSSSSVEEIRAKGVENRHLYCTSPENDEEVALYYHLMLVRRLFYALEQGNALLAPDKLKLHCQDSEHKYLGITFRGISAMMPLKTKTLLLNMKPPTSVKKIQEICGLLNFYSSITRSLRVHCSFLSAKLRKSSVAAGFSWTDSDQEKWEFLLQVAANANAAGFISLLDPKLKNRVCYLLCDWSREAHASSCILITKFVDKDNKLQVLPCYADSRLLPKSCLSSSCCSELASLAYSVAAVAPLLQFNATIAYTDSLSLVFLLKRRYDSKLTLNSSVASRLINSLLVFGNLTVRYIPGKINPAADTLSRMKTVRGTPYDEALLTSQTIEEYDEIDEFLRPYVKTETTIEFEKRRQELEDTLIKLEKLRGNDYDEVIKEFSQMKHTTSEVDDIIQSLETAPFPDPKSSYQVSTLEHVKPNLWPFLKDLSERDPKKVADVVEVDKFERQVAAITRSMAKNQPSARNDAVIEGEEIEEAEMLQKSEKHGKNTQQQHTSHPPSHKKSFEASKLDLRHAQTKETHCSNQPTAEHSISPAAKSTSTSLHVNVGSDSESTQSLPMPDIDAAAAATCREVRPKEPKSKPAAPRVAAKKWETNIPPGITPQQPAALQQPGKNKEKGMREHENERIPDRIISDKNIVKFRQKAFIPELKHHDFELHPDGLDLQDRIAIEDQSLEFKPEDLNSKDWLSLVLKNSKNNCSNMTKLGMRRSRIDSMVIATYPDLRDACLSENEGIVPLGTDESANMVYDTLIELNYIRAVSSEVLDEPLFDTFEEALRYVKKGQVSDSIKHQYRYFKQCQDNDEAISLARDLKLGLIDATDSRVDALRRLDNLGKTLIDSQSSLFVVDQLLFKLAFPRKSERMRCGLVLNGPDCKRALVKYHQSKGLHRGAHFCYAVMSHTIWTPNLLQLATEVVRECSTCCSFHFHAKPVKTTLETLLCGKGESGTIDLKGPISLKSKSLSHSNLNSKAYILVVFLPTVNFTCLSFLPDKTPLSVSRKLFSEFLAYFPGISHLKSDAGGEFNSAVTRSLYSLYNITVTISTSNNPKSNPCERRIQTFSKVLKVALQTGPLGWPESLKICMHVLNQLTSHPQTKMSASQLYALGTGDSPASQPAILVGTAPEVHPHWSHVAAKAKAIIDAIRKHYGVYVSIKRTNQKTLQSMNIQEGSRVWYRMHREPKVLACGYASILPRVAIGFVVRFLGRTSVVLKSDVTGKMLYRNIIDLTPFIPSTWNYNLNFHSANKEYEREQRGLDLEILTDPQKHTRRAMDEALKEGQVGHQPRRRNNRTRLEPHLQDTDADAEAVDERVGDDPKSKKTRPRTTPPENESIVDPDVIATSSDESDEADELIPRTHRRRSKRLAAKRRGDN